MSFLNISIYLSALIGVIIIAWIRSFDIYEKETSGRCYGLFSPEA
jgi:hypothetical protein